MQPNLCALAGLLTIAVILPAAPLPVRGIQLIAPQPPDLGIFLRLVKNGLPREGVNTLILEFGYRYRFTSHPEVAERNALTKSDVRSIADACRAAGIHLIPLVDLLGHQSSGEQQRSLLRTHPEFIEPSRQYPCRNGKCYSSYCPLHPSVHALVFDLVDEIVDACGADAFHAGLDEVVVLGDDTCPRCSGKNRAWLFAQEVRAIHDHLARRGCRLWMWGDRLLDGAMTGLGKWEASENGTAPAIRDIPRDIVICDWHYSRSVPTAAYFAVEGFDVVSCPWRESAVAIADLNQVQSVGEHSPDALGHHMLGVLQTVWSDSGSFARSYFGELTRDRRTSEALECLKALFREIRRRGLNSDE